MALYKYSSVPFLFCDIVIYYTLSKL